MKGNLGCLTEGEKIKSKHIILVESLLVYNLLKILKKNYHFSLVMGVS